MAFKTGAVNRLATSPHNKIRHLERISGGTVPASIQHKATPRTPDSHEWSSGSTQQLAQAFATREPFLPSLRVILDPFGESFSTDLSGSDSENKTLLFVHIAVEFMTVQNEKNLDRGVSHPLVAVNEWMV